MQRHPVAQTVTHVDFHDRPAGRGHRADVPITLVGEALEVQHGDGLVDQQMFTLPIRALPGAIPTVARGRHQRADHRWPGPGVGPCAARGASRPTSTPSRPIAIGQPPRVVTAEGEGAEGEGEEGAAGETAEPTGEASAEHGRRGLGPAPRFRPVRSAGGPRPTCWSSGWATRVRSSPGPCTTPGPMPSTCWPSATVPPCGRRRACRPGSAVSSVAGTAGGAGRADHLHERVGARRARAGASASAIDDPAAVVIVHDELDLPPGTVRLKAGGGLAGHNGLRSIAAHLHTNDFLRVRIGVGKPPSAAQGAAHVLKRPPRGGPRAPGHLGRDRGRRRRAHRGGRHRRRHGVVPFVADLNR